MSANQDDAKKKDYDSLESYKSDREWFKPRKKIVGYRTTTKQSQKSLSFAGGEVKPKTSFKINYQPENLDAFRNFIIHHIASAINTFLEPWLNVLVDIEETNPNNFFSRKRLHPWKNGEYIGFNFLSYDLSQKLAQQSEPKILLSDETIVKLDSDLNYYLRKELYWFDSAPVHNHQMKNIANHTVALTMDLSQLKFLINVVVDDVFQNLNLPSISTNNK